MLSRSNIPFFMSWIKKVKFTMLSTLFWNREKSIKVFRYKQHFLFLRHRQCWRIIIILSNSHWYVEWSITLCFVKFKSQKRIQSAIINQNSKIVSFGNSRSLFIFFYNDKSECLKEQDNGNEYIEWKPSIWSNNYSYTISTVSTAVISISYIFWSTILNYIYLFYLWTVSVCSATIIQFFLQSEEPINALKRVWILLNTLSLLSFQRSN